MGDHSKIEWTDATWNPIRGCSAVSPGCANCYAATVAARFNGPGMPYEGLATRDPRPRWTGEVRLVPEHLADPLRWQRPRRVFVNSMSDLFHESLPFEIIAAIFGVMAAAERHVFQVLTKRPARMLEWFEWYEGSSGFGGGSAFAAVFAAREHGVDVGWPCYDSVRRATFEPAWPLPNVWLGVSAEDQQRANERIPLLLKCPAAVRWVSAEPLLGSLWIVPRLYRHADERLCGLGGCEKCRRLDWVVVGGESGPGARLCDVAWIGSVVEQCAAAGVPVVQHPMDPEALLAGGLADRKGGDPEEWPDSLRVRQMPEAPHV